ncbi:hypothetical protein CKALI_05100 [Corynebacterium kalinowskii]|uniref:DUF2339 domain-containing protein n=1 Tax=Corynebacterium kalinowskii TaxID=2675216 RepID=A0A6B8VK99_9CORY|nr:DUF2339 domain-containing protein [Corynebacterium kalinowskii]QGU01894.1 hypothetical protein CKALI_05100 [Corynebacterium kalinowskii]
MKLNPNEDAQLRQVAKKLQEAEALLGDVRELLFTLYESQDQAVQPAPAPKPVPVAPPLLRPAAVEKPAKPVSAEKVVIRLVAAAGVFVTLLGVAFLLWLVWNLVGPLGRVVAAWLISVLLFVGAVLVRHFKLANEGRIAFATASQLTSSLTVMATVSLLHWWTPLTGAIVLLLLLAFFAGVARLWNSELMLIITNLAGFALFIGYVFFGDFFSFPVIAPVLFLAVASMQRQWFTARTLAAACGPIAVLVAATDEANVNHAFPISLTVLLGVAVFVAVPLIDDWRSRSDIYLGCYSPVAMLLIGGVFADTFLELTIMIFLFVAFALLSVMFHGAHAVAPLTALPIVYLFWWAKAPELGSGSLIAQPWLVALYFLVASGFAWWLGRNNRYSWYPWASMFVVSLIISGELAMAVFTRKPLWLTDHVALVQVLTISVFIGVVLLVRRALQGFSPVALVIIGLGGLHLSTLVVVGLSTYVFGLLGDDGMRLGYLLGHAAVSLLWLLLGAYILIITRKLSERTSLMVGLVLTLASLFKLLFFDMSTLDSFIRFITFLFEGVLLLVIASLRARRTKTLQQVPQESAGMGPHY